MGIIVKCNQLCQEAKNPLDKLKLIFDKAFFFKKLGDQGFEHEYAFFMDFFDC